MLLAKQSSKEEQQLKARLSNRNNLTAYFERAESESAPRRRMSVQEIHSQNKRMYSKLPEVQARLRVQHLEKVRELNRIKSSIYNKVKVPFSCIDVQLLLKWAITFFDFNYFFKFKPINYTIMILWNKKYTIILIDYIFIKF